MLKYKDVSSYEQINKSELYMGNSTSKVGGIRKVSKNDFGK